MLLFIKVFACSVDYVHQIVRNIFIFVMFILYYFFFVFFTVYFFFGTFIKLRLFNFICNF
ncbi:MAG TPA: hypothetical protein DHV76_02395 [Ruminococcaceae bacterium]|nr:hypothetical protein [Oscillospiraceae bacterium]HCJ95897.1 hypothetical protein [Oscillospiraceae bacterium]